MKKIVRRMTLGTMCFLLAQPVYSMAAGTAKLSIQRDEVIFQLKNFDVTSEDYRLLLLAETEFQGESVWVCIDDRACGAQELYENYVNQKGHIEGVPFAESVAVKLFEECENAWEDCFGLCRSSKGFSKDAYSVTISNGDTDKEEQKLYVLMEQGARELSEESKENQGSTILPLELAEELYGFSAERQGDRMVFIAPDGLFSDDPVLFACIEEDADGILLEEHAARVSVRELARPKVEKTTGQETVMEAQESAETELQGTEEPGRESQEITELQETAETETHETKENGAELQELTESQEATGTEERGTEQQELTGTETQETEERGTEPRKVAEIEPQGMTESQGVAETEPQDTEENGIESQEIIEPAASTEQETGIYLTLPVFAVLAGCLIYFLQDKQKRNKASLEKGRVKGSFQLHIDDEVTIEPERTVAAREEIRCVQAAVINHKGCVRKNNEDNFYFNGTYMRRKKMDDGALLSDSFRDAVQVYAVCDGMGGADAGEEASHCAVEELALKASEHSRMKDPGELKSVLRSISEKVCKEAMQRKQKSGTTIVMMVIAGGQAVFANVGDSRIYRFREGKLTQISLDHSKVQRMISMGLLTPEQARTSPDRHVITQYLGMASEVKISPYISGEKLCKGDLYLLCSDGLTDMVEDDQIESVLREKSSLQAALQELLKTALKNGGRDNVTIMLIHTS